MSPRNFAFRLSAFNAFLFLGSGIQMAFLPLWLKDRGLGEADIALVMAMMMAVRIFAMPAGTYVADVTKNRKRVIHIAAAGAFAAYVALQFASGFWPILAVAMLAAALLAPVVPLSETLALEGAAHFGIDYGRIRLWASLSFLAGSLIAGALLDVIPVNRVILLIAGAQGLGAVMTLVLPADHAMRRSSGEAISVRHIARLVMAPVFIIFLAAAAIGQSSHGLLYAMGSVHFDALGYSKFTIGKLWAASVLTEIVMFAFARHFHKALGSVQLIVLGTGLAALRWWVTGAEPPLAVMYGVQMLHAASFGFTHLGTMHYIRENVPDHMRNSVQGIFSALSSGVLMAATMWSSGPLYGALGGHAFFVMAAIAGIAFGLALMLGRISPRAP